jgi:hypothetical protein
MIRGFFSDPLAKNREGARVLPQDAHLFLDESVMWRKGSKIPPLKVRFIKILPQFLEIFLRPHTSEHQTPAS